MQVKVCGITNLNDALFAVELGVWALGFNFYVHSPRYIDPKLAAAIIAQLPAAVLKVGIFVNAAQSLIVKIQAETGITHIQLHGDEPLVWCQQFAQPVIKALRPTSNKDLLKLPEAAGAYAVLVDAASAALFGGSGELANWKLAAQQATQCPTILAGGLTANNIVAAIEQVQPFAVDVCSGVEQALGKKSATKLTEFFAMLKTLRIIL